MLIRYLKEKEKNLPHSIPFPKPHGDPTPAKTRDDTPTVFKVLNDDDLLAEILAPAVSSLSRDLEEDTDYGDPGAWSG